VLLPAISIAYLLFAWKMRIFPFEKKLVTRPEDFTQAKIYGEGKLRLGELSGVVPRYELPGLVRLVIQ
jgi:hypothetical protein